MSNEKEAAGCGCSVGSVLAFMLSLAINDSLAWAILHAIFGWCYVFYALFFRFYDIVQYFKHHGGL